jgi:polysaccharide export outer membrane protein
MNPTNILKSTRFIVCAGLAVAQLAGQPLATPAAPQTEFSNGLRPTYVLGPEDVITLRAFEVEEISDKPFRIDSEGFINLPILGRIRAGGFTLDQFEADLMRRLKTIVKEPQVTVKLAQLRREPVFFVGAFKAPGIYPLEGQRTLVEMLTAVGGLQPYASRRIKVTRQLQFGRIPLPNAVSDAENKVSVVEINFVGLTESVNPLEDIALQPFDRVSVDKAELVYVSGEVNKVAGVELGERNFISITQLITTAGGLTKDAVPSKARILRPILNSSRRAQIPVNLTKIMEGKEADFPVLANDFLYVPRSSSKVAWRYVALIVVPIAITTGVILATR